MPCTCSVLRLTHPGPYRVGLLNHLGVGMAVEAFSFGFTIAVRAGVNGVVDTIAPIFSGRVWRLAPA